MVAYQSESGVHLVNGDFQGGPIYVLALFALRHCERGMEGRGGGGPSWSVREERTRTHQGIMETAIDQDLNHPISSSLTS